MREILQVNPDVNAIITDLSPFVVKEWKRVYVLIMCARVVRELMVHGFLFHNLYIILGHVVLII